MPTRMATSGDERGTKRVRRSGASNSTTVQRRRCPPFSMLPDDLLVVIYRFLADHPSSRACFASVCSSWRAAVAAEPRVPVLPWLLLSPRDASYRARHAHCPQDGAALRFEVPRGAVGRRLVGGYDGGWVVSSQPAPLRIVNLFICAEVALSEKQRRITCPRRDHGRGDTRCPVVVSKIVFSETPTSDTCIMAAMTENCGIALCRVGCPDVGWTIHGCRVEGFIDIAFCKGKLYGLSHTHFDAEFVKFEIGVNKHGAPVLIAETRIALEMVTGQRQRWESSCKEYAGYIVDLNGGLMIAMITWWNLRHEPFFKVYELVEGGAMKCNNYKWVEVTCLADHALFLGQTFSKAVHVSADICGDIERNRIYYFKSKNGRRSLNAEVHGDAVFLMISNNDSNLKYKKEDRSNVADDDEKIMSVEYFVKDGRHDSMWLLPPNI